MNRPHLSLESRGLPEAPSARKTSFSDLTPKLRRRWRRATSAVLGAALIISAIGCGAPEPAPEPPGPFAAGGKYANRCLALNTEQRLAVRENKYIPAELLIHRWPKTPGKPAGAPTGLYQSISEERFVELLRSKGSRIALLIARGGTGKSKLAWSVEAQICAVTPTFRVDLQWEVARTMAAAAPGENPLLRVIASRLGASAKEDAQRTVASAIGKGSMLLLLDSLDEVSLEERPKVVAHINAAIAGNPGLNAVVLTRPPVYTGNYGLEPIDALVELPMLSCERTAMVRKRLLPKAETAGFDTFASRYALDRKVITPRGRCYYPHLATFRDFFVVRKLAKSHATPDAAGMVKSFESNRSQLYEFYLRVSLVKDLQGIGLVAEDAMKTVDKMLATRNPGAGERNIDFHADDCLAATTAVPQEKRKAVCERLLQSSLFERASQTGRWRLKNQSIYDLFLARWTHAQMAAKPKGAACKVITERSDLFESNEVAGFLVGLHWGRKCLVDITNQLCKRGGYAQHNFEQLDQGLPTGKARMQLIDDAQNGIEGLLEPHLCVGATLDRLYKAAEKTLPAAAVKDPVKAPEKAPAKAPAKSKSKRKSKK